MHERWKSWNGRIQPRREIVQLRYFAGMSMAEIAEVVGQAEITIHRHWRFTRAWIKQRIGEGYAK